MTEEPNSAKRGIGAPNTSSSCEVSDCGGGGVVGGAVGGGWGGGGGGGLTNTATDLIGTGAEPGDHALISARNHRAGGGNSTSHGTSGGGAALI